MAEENETPGARPGQGPEGAGRRPEGDLFAERRARRAAESGEIALTRRAEAAEATVQTLEIHVASLQQRLLEAEEERRRLGELLEAERTVALEREHDLRRVKQREYAEQQLRVEAEDRLVGLDRDGRAEAQELSQRLSASEREAAGLGERMLELQRQLAEAEQAAAAERASLRRAEEDLRGRLEELEARASEIQLGLEAERSARQHTQSVLDGMREGHRRMEGLVGELKVIVSRLGSGLAAPSGPLQALPPAPSAAPPAEPPPVGLPPAEPPPAQTQTLGVVSAGPAEPLVEHVLGGAAAPADQAGAEEMAEALAAAVARLRARADAAPEPPGPEAARPRPAKVPHKHSFSLIGRMRNRRKQRRGL